MQQALSGTWRFLVCSKTQSCATSSMFCLLDDTARIGIDWNFGSLNVGTDLSNENVTRGRR